MAFIPGYEHDVFVSYAHVDDQPFIDAAAGLERSSGWVSTLVRHLKNELAQKIGRSDALSVWFDSNNLRGNHKLIDEIAARLERAAIFVAILSPVISPRNGARTRRTCLRAVAAATQDDGCS
jgi:hypothetical protein